MTKLDKNWMLMVSIQFYILDTLNIDNSIDNIDHCTIQIAKNRYFLCQCKLPSVKFQMTNVASMLAYF